ncbi:MAG: hypothetical protein F9Y92_07490 [Thermoplasmatales archaeon]|nr:hypothetical protein [Thermoplasmatales archaeon]
MILYGVRKAIAKQKGPHKEYLFIMLPSRYCNTFNIRKGDGFLIRSTKKGNLYLVRVDKND